MGMPYSSSPFHRIIEAVAHMKAKGAIATFGMILLFCCFIATLLSTNGVMEWVFGLICLLGILVIIFAILRTKSSEISSKIKDDY